jgi:hypothetical protein
MRHLAWPMMALGLVAGNATAHPRVWSEVPVTVPGFTDDVEGADVALVNDNPRPEMVLSAYVRPVNRCLRDCAEDRDFCMSEFGQPGGPLKPPRECVQQYTRCFRACTTQVGSYILGKKVLMPGNQDANPPADETVTVTGQSSLTSSPYYFVDIPSGQKTVSVSKPPGWSVGYTLCLNRQDCHAPLLPIRGSSVSFDLANDMKADLWWHYYPDPDGNFFEKVVDSSEKILPPLGMEYAYAPSIIKKNGEYHVFFCSTGDEASWDFIRYTKSTDGRTWTDPTIVLRANQNEGRDMSACDPSVIKFGDFYYLFYTGAVVTAPGTGIPTTPYEHGRSQATVQVARSLNLAGPYKEVYTSR